MFLYIFFYFYGEGYDFFVVVVFGVEIEMWYYLRIYVVNLRRIGLEFYGIVYCC